MAEAIFFGSLQLRVRSPHEGTAHFNGIAWRRIIVTPSSSHPPGRAVTANARALEGRIRSLREGEVSRSWHSPLLLLSLVVLPYTMHRN